MDTLNGKPRPDPEGRNATLAAGNDSAWRRRRSKVEGDMAGLEAELLAYESLISELGQALRALQPMDVLFNKWGGRFDVRWWMINEGNDWRTPKLVRWRKQRDGGWFPCPIDRKPLVQHYNGIARAPEVAMMVIEARQRIEEYEVRRARYCELAASFRQRPEPETRSKAAELLALRARVEDFTARAVAEKAAERAERQ